MRTIGGKSNEQKNNLTKQIFKIFLKASIQTPVFSLNLLITSSGQGTRVAPTNV